MMNNYVCVYVSFYVLHFTFYIYILHFTFYHVFQLKLVGFFDETSSSVDRYDNVKCFPPYMT